MTTARRLIVVTLAAALAGCAADTDNPPDDAAPSSSAPPACVEEKDVLTLVDDGFTLYDDPDNDSWDINYAAVFEAANGAAIAHSTVEIRWYNADGDQLALYGYDVPSDYDREVTGLSRVGEDGRHAVTGTMMLDEPADSVEYTVTGSCVGEAPVGPTVAEAEWTQDGDTATLDTTFTETLSDKETVTVVLRNADGSIVGGTNVTVDVGDLLRDTESTYRADVKLSPPGMRAVEVEVFPLQ